MLLAAVGLSGVLASCGGTVVLVSDPVTSLQLLEYKSGYTLPAAYTDTGTGTVYAAGSSIICDNLSTKLSATLDWNGDAARFGFQLEGSKGGKATVYTGVSSNGYSANPTTFEITVGAGVAPLSVKANGLDAQAIVVTPVNTFTVKGYTFLNVVGVNRNGSQTAPIESVQAIPVADCTV